MRAEERERLTWEAATERFLDVAELKGEERATKVSAAVDTLAFNLYNYLTGQSRPHRAVANVLQGPDANLLHSLLARSLHNSHDKFCRVTSALVTR